MSSVATDRDTRTVFQVDDHAIVRRGLKAVLERENGLSVCGYAESAPEALRRMSELQPDLAVVDISLPGRSGLDLVEDICGRIPSADVLVLSVHDEFLYAERALRAGASGYVMKSESVETIVEAVRTVLAGQMYVSDDVSNHMMRRFLRGEDSGQSTVEALSDRELEVFERIGKGMSTREIAADLCLSVKTIETYREQIKRKLELDNVTELLQHAFRWVQDELAC
jgi:DNA-binding NarL/FixJ family response regulator